MFFLSVHSPFSGIDHMLGHKVNLSKLKNIEIINATTLDEDMAGSKLNSFTTIILEVFNFFKYNNRSLT